MIHIQQAVHVKTNTLEVHVHLVNLQVIDILPGMLFQIGGKQLSIVRLVGSSQYAMHVLQHRH